jgi:hypothetical protein
MPQDLKLKTTKLKRGDICVPRPLGRPPNVEKHVARLEV